MEPRLKLNKIIFRGLQCSAVRPVLSCGGLRFVRRWSAVWSAVVCGGLQWSAVFRPTNFQSPCDTSAIQLEALRPIYIGNKCSAAAECPVRQFTLSRLLCHRCPFRCQHHRTDDGTPDCRPNYCLTVPVLSRCLSHRPVIF